MIRPCKKRGISVLECVVALSVMAAMLTTLLSIQVVQSTRVRLAQQRLIAQQTLANLAHRALAARYEEVEAESLQAWLQETETQQGLPAGTLRVEIEPVEQPAVGRRIEFIWNGSSPRAPRYRLDAWRFAPPPQQADSTEEDA